MMHGSHRSTQQSCYRLLKALMTTLNRMSRPVHLMVWYWFNQHHLSLILLLPASIDLLAGAASPVACHEPQLEIALM